MKNQTNLPSADDDTGAILSTAWKEICGLAVDSEAVRLP